MYCSYKCSVDMWSVGTIFAELLGRIPMFQGKNTIDQLRLIMEAIGKPSLSVLAPSRSKKCNQFIQNFPEVVPCSFRFVKIIEKWMASQSYIY